MAGALTTFVTVIVSVLSTATDLVVDAAASGTPNLANIDGGWPAGGGGRADDEVKGTCDGGGAALVCRGSGNGARGGAGSVTVPNRGTGAAAFGVTQPLSDGCTRTPHHFTGI